MTSGSYSLEDSAGNDEDMALTGKETSPEPSPMSFNSPCLRSHFTNCPAFADLAGS